VRAALGDGPLTPLLEQLVLPIRQSLPPAPWPAPWAGVEGLERAVQANARAAAAALPQSSQLLAQALAEGRLRIQPAYLDIGSGLVSLL
jgi:carbonic anhydrase